MTNIKEYAITEWNSFKINFWNLSKCGGTSIKFSLLKKEGLDSKIKDIEKLNKKVHNNEYIRYIDKSEAMSNGNLNISVIRHPYHRVLSIYKDFSLTRKQSLPVFERIVDQDKIYDINYFLDIYIKQGTDKDNLHLRSYVWSLCDENKKVLIDKIYQFDNINQLFLDYDLEYTHRNVSENTEVQFNREQKEIIFNRYKDDFEIFNFEK